MTGNNSDYAYMASPICQADGCLEMKVDVEFFFEVPLSLCPEHAKKFRDILNDIVLLDDIEWMREWAHEELKDEYKSLWDKISKID